MTWPFSVLLFCVWLLCSLPLEKNISGGDRRKNSILGLEVDFIIFLCGYSADGGRR